MKHLLLLILLLVTIGYSDTTKTNEPYGLNINASVSMSNLGTGFELGADGESFGTVLGMEFKSDSIQYRSFTFGASFPVTDNLRVTSCATIDISQSQRYGAGPTVGIKYIPIPYLTITPVLSLKQGLLFKDSNAIPYTSISIGIGFGKLYN